MFNRFSTLKDPQKERTLFNRRIWTIAFFIALLVFCLIIRLVYLQIFQHQVYTTLAKQNQLNLSPAEPNRGLIYDRKGVLLAENVPVYNLVVTPNRASNLKASLGQLQQIIPISKDDLNQFYKQLTLHRRFEPLPLRTRLTEEEVARFSVNQYRFPGFNIQAEMIRHYPFGSAFASLVGYVGRINAKELGQVDPSNYSATNFIGKTGVEKYYEPQLHGQVGYKQVESDASGQIVRIASQILPTPGDNLYLTIDSKLQLKAQEILGEQRAAVVAMNPQNGEILALISTPTFDPNLFVAGINQHDYDALEKAPGQPLYNRALRGRYPAGSTIKPFISLEGLVSGAITPDSVYYDPGWFKLKDSEHTYYGFRREAHGNVNLVKAITESSDIYFYNLAVKLGIEHIADMLSRFGFGQKTGIDLSEELAGILPTPQWKEKITHKPWYPGDTLNVGIGQGFMEVTPLQLAAAVAGIANRGQRWQPHVLLHSQTADGTQTAYSSLALPSVELDKSIWKTIITGMKGVANSPDGTAYPFFKDADYTVAGKTGTAQVFSLKGQRYNKSMLPVNLRDNSLFICFAPADKPQIALAVIVQNYTTPAAQVARRLLDYYFSTHQTDGTADKSNDNATGAMAN